MSPWPSMRQRAATLALELTRAHEPAMERHLRIEWNSRFTWRLGDARILRERGRTVAGIRLACPQAKGRLVARMRLSIPLWPRASEEERDNTVAHELGHLIQRWRQRRGDYENTPRSALTSHGAAWRSVMRELGYPATRCHAVPTGAAKACAGGCDGVVYVPRGSGRRYCPGCLAAKIEKLKAKDGEFLSMVMGLPPGTVLLRDE